MHKMTQEVPEALDFKIIVYTLYTDLLAQMLLRFVPPPAVYEIQRCRNSEKHQTTPEWP